MVAQRLLAFYRANITFWGTYVKEKLVRYCRGSELGRRLVSTGLFYPVRRDIAFR